MKIVKKNDMSVKIRPTPRAVDNWESPRFLAVSDASAEFRFWALVRIPPSCH
jgi:hypothetical protein